jgi:hypothetical protein
MNMAALIKTEPGTCKPEANKSIAAKAPSSKNKISLLPYAVNGANSSTNIKKRATLQAGRNCPPSKSKPKCAPMNPKKKPRLSAPPGSDLIRSFCTTPCRGCDENPCANVETILLIHSNLKKANYKDSTYEGVAGNNRRRRHFNDEYKKSDEGGEPDIKCGVEFARKWFPRET